jgi:hypothetical protein
MATFHDLTLLTKNVAYKINESVKKVNAYSTKFGPMTLDGVKKACIGALNNERLPTQIKQLFVLCDTIQSLRESLTFGQKILYSERIRADTRYGSASIALPPEGWLKRIIEQQNTILDTLVLDEIIEPLTGVEPPKKEPPKETAKPPPKETVDDLLFLSYEAAVPAPTVFDAVQEGGEKVLVNRKKNIPKHIKTLVWNLYVGVDKLEAKCFSCRAEKIDARHFQCGHVIAEAKGGDITIKNLRPICQPCNSSMGTQSMNEFTKDYFGWELAE